MSHSLPDALYQAQQVREMDQRAMQQPGVDGLTLMRRAGACAFMRLRREWPRTQRLLVVAGSGNNGGDGFIVAALARRAGMQVSLVLVGDDRKLAPTAAQAFAELELDQIDYGPFTGALPEADVVVDALLGIGLHGRLQPDYREVIDAINRHRAPVLALDIPSGLDANTGHVTDRAVVANHTVTFIAAKPGLLTAEGPAHCGTLHLERLGVEPGDLRPSVRLLNQEALMHNLLPRRRTAHKGAFGHLLLVGGDHGMMGAVQLAAAAAVRSGAGLVSVATRASHAPMVTQALSELMSHGVEAEQALTPLLARATVVAIGPGLGQSIWAQALLDLLLPVQRPMVFDADALNLLGRHAHVPRENDRVYTPHPGEAARLLGWRTDEVQSDRFAAIHRLQQQFGGWWVLKGSGTLVCGPDQQIELCPYGNPGMATGGMGDLLTGIIASLISQRIPVGDAVRLGVCLHSRAGDLAAQDGERGMLASDLLLPLRRLVNPA